MKTSLTFLILLALAGCASEPLTPEEAYRYQQAGAALSGMGQQLQQQQLQQQQQAPGFCMSRPNGYGGYNYTCY